MGGLNKLLYFLNSRNKDIPYQKNLVQKIKEIHIELTSQNYSEVIAICNVAIGLCDQIKNYAVNSIKNEDVANSSFVVKEYCKMLKYYSMYWQLLLQKKFKDSWTLLQDTFDKLRNITRFTSDHESYSLNVMHDHLNQLERLYPYRIFASMEAVVQSKKCSICGKSLLDLDCTHLPGELYWGEQAFAVAGGIVLQGLALVQHPMDKRCIMEISGDTRTEEEKFSLLNYFVDNNKNPLQLFTVVEEIKYYYNDGYNNTGRNDPCPCQSGKKFKKCCGQDKYEEGTHFRIQLKNELELSWLS